MRVVFTGASGQGKSTMANYVAGAYDLPLVGKSGAEVAAGLGVPHAEIDARGLRRTYQRAVADAVLKAFMEGPADFVTDRAFDFAAYAALEGVAAAHERRTAVLVGHCLRECVVFLVEPSVMISGAARVERGPVKYLDWDYIQRVHGGLLTLLRIHEVPFHLLSATSRAAREQIVRDVLDPVRAKEMAASLAAGSPAR